MLVVLFLATAMALFGKTISVKEAENEAIKFLYSRNVECKNGVKRMAVKSAPLSLVYEVKADAGNSNLYVFNQGEQGFVVVAGDDKINPILGYADEGVFDENNMPDGFRFWLESCNDYIEEVVNGGFVNEDLTSLISQKSNYASSISPLLGDIEFHQSDPYNRQCPIVEGERTIVGCGAISMGQIMTYYQWPKQGQGSYSYTTNTEGLSVSADFNTTYNWNNILHSYNDNYTSQQVSEVAKLLFHCGVSVGMDYGIYGSSTSDVYIPEAMTKYFGYDKGMQIHYRPMYNFSDWKNIIKEELNNNRPIVYCAQSADGGHAFNCDGYDRNDYFHINWGWGGYYNGYYDLRYLDYESDKNTAFNRRHSIIVGIKPDKGDGTGTKTELTHNLMITLAPYIDSGLMSLGIRNMGGGTFYGDVAVGVYYNDNLQTQELPCGGWGSDSLRIDLNNYSIKENSIVQPIYREHGSSEWKLIPGEKGIYYKWKLEDGEWVAATSDATTLELLSFEPIGELTSTEYPQFKISFKNVGVSDYYGDVLFRLFDGDYSIDIQLTEFAVVLQEESCELIFTLNDLVPDGKYTAIVYYNRKDGWYSAIYNKNEEYEYPVIIGNGGSSYEGKPELNLYDYSRLNKTDFVFGEELTYTAYINNTGEAGYVNLSIDVYDLDDEWQGMLCYADNYYASSGYNTISLSGILSEESFSAGDYRVKIWLNDYDNYENSSLIEPVYYNTLDFSVQKENQAPVLEMVDVLNLNRKSYFPGETIEASFSLKNTGAAGYVNVGMAMKMNDATWNPELGSNVNNFYLAKNATKDMTLSIDIPYDCAKGDYQLIIYEQRDNECYFIDPQENSLVYVTIEEFDGKYEIEVNAIEGEGKLVGAGRYEYGSEVVIAAIPDYGYKFYRWSDKNKENPRVVSVEGRATYEAEFRQITFSLEAQPNDDAFEFVEWSDGEIENPRTIILSQEESLEYTAIFRMKETVIENAYISSAHVYTNSGTLYVVGAEIDYLVFDEAGKLIYSGCDVSIQLPNGVYLVRLGKEIQKVVL